MNFYYSCSTVDVNLGNQQQCDFDLTAACKLAIVPDSFTFATKTAALLKTNWDAAMADDRPDRMYLTPVADQMAAADEEDTPIERPFKGGKLLIYGDKGFTMDFMINPYLVQQFALFDWKGKSALVIDQNENVFGLSDDGTKIRGRKITSFNVSYPTPAPGEAQVLRLHVMFSDQRNYLKTIVAFNPAEEAIVKWSPRNDLDGVYFIELLQVGTWSATGGVLSVKFAHNGKPVTGLAAADFEIPSKTITSATYSAVTGYYTIVASALVTSTINAVLPAVNTLYPTLLVESIAPAVITIT